MRYTLGMTIAATREVVAAVGEDHFASDAAGCVYRAADGSPSCLVGRILQRLGVDLDDLFPPADGDFRHNGYTVDMLDLDGFSSEAVTFLSDLQVEQDAGRPWGACLAKARRAAGP